MLVSVGELGQGSDFNKATTQLGARQGTNMMLYSPLLDKSGGVSTGRESGPRRPVTQL